MDRLEKRLRLSIAGQQRIGVAMIRPAKRADADLHGLHPEPREIIERLLEWHGTKDHSEDAEFHGSASFTRCKLGMEARPPGARTDIHENAQVASSVANAKDIEWHAIPPDGARVRSGVPAHARSSPVAG